jgi:hypothetical protein
MHVFCGDVPLFMLETHLSSKPAAYAQSRNEAVHGSSLVREWLL